MPTVALTFLVSCRLLLLWQLVVVVATVVVACTCACSCCCHFFARNCKTRFKAPHTAGVNGQGRSEGLHASYGYIQIGFRATVGNNNNENNNNKWHRLKVHFVCSSRQVKVKAATQLRRLRCQLHLHLHLGLLHHWHWRRCAAGSSHNTALLIYLAT